MDPRFTGFLTGELAEIREQGREQWPIWSFVKLPTQG